MKVAASLLALTLTLPLAADAVEEVRQAEIGFAKAFADRDKAKFFSYVADDAVFMGALNVQRGKEAVIERWSRFFDNTPVAPFSWGPERVEVTAGGTVGFSTGPIYLPDRTHIGNYSSVWQKQKDGSWKIILDGSGQPPAPVGDNVAKLEEGQVALGGGAKLSYRKLGLGSPVTLIVPDASLYDVFQQLADMATIVTYEPRKGATLEQQVADLEALRAQVKAEKFIPVGHAQSASLAAAYAARHPEHVSRVIEIAPATSPSADDIKNVKAQVLVIHSDKAWAQPFADARVVAVPAAWRTDPISVFGAIRHFLRGEWPLGSAKLN